MGTAINPRPYGGWLNFRYLELNGRIRRGISRPRRERVIVRNALKRIRLVYHEIFPFYNPLYNGWKNETEGSIAWLDFVVYERTVGMFVILFVPKYGQSGLKRHEREAFNKKQNYMEQRGIPVLVLSRRRTSQEYEAQIRMFVLHIRNKRKETI